MKISHISAVTFTVWLCILAGCWSEAVVMPSPPRPSPLPSVKQPMYFTPTAATKRVAWDDLKLDLKGDDRWNELQVTAAVRAYEGQRISVSGLMWGGVEKPRGLERFVLMRNQEKYGPGYPVDQLMQVRLQSGKTVNFSTQTIRVEGKLRIEPEVGADGNLWSLYILDDATIPAAESSAN